MRIVLVDPSRAVQRAMTRLVEEGGHEVVTFSEGLKALAYINQDPHVRALIQHTAPGYQRHPALQRCSRIERDPSGSTCRADVIHR